MSNEEIERRADEEIASIEQDESLSESEKSKMIRAIMREAQQMMSEERD